jgi:hypothetical protein
MVKPAKGTTTLAFIFKEGVIVAADSRASMGGYICMFIHLFVWIKFWFIVLLYVCGGGYVYSIYVWVKFWFTVLLYLCVVVCGILFFFLD